ncbi:DUF2180 family protein [Streptomyces caatingaensis]|uniref:DUF2180 family protein n=1 Tax=Streptomyces caatingaensis TaxID=1678637 RepID=A0A0K9XEM6_9ACTN|nr:DUF2180 family protein [Streptomyces caatingaensis]KNB51658.1 hypothetical protein AC230_15060 [Streptomyces caatingaensis]
MNCYDCHAAAGAAVPAVAVCHGCSSGLCPAHLLITRPEIHRPNGVGVVHAPARARRVWCATCHAAQAAGAPAVSTA